MEYLSYQFPFLDQSFLGFSLQTWIILPTFIVGSFIFFYLILLTAKKVLSSFTTENSFLQTYFFSAVKPFALAFTAVAFQSFQNIYFFDIENKDPLFILNTLLYTIAITWIVLIYISNLSMSLQSKYSAATAIISLFRKIAKAFVVILAFLFLLQNLGFDIAAMITALGVGGIAIALASQKTIENLFGGIVLSLDQPIRVGDTGIFGDTIGTIEDIGLRSTRIRTLKRTIVTIPNSQMSSMAIETFASRDQLLFNHTVGVRYETNIAQLTHIIKTIKEHFLNHEHVKQDSVRVRFTSFNDASQDINIFAYVTTTDWSTFLLVQEELLFMVKTIIEEAGSDFAFPSQTIYLGKDSGINESLKKQISKKAVLKNNA